ncbi:hypothetical protein NL676_001689 [Syzygium grande]|nr:hypothetical protein NL676_001689 [Syzygium grande]
MKLFEMCKILQPLQWSHRVYAPITVKLRPRRGPIPHPQAESTRAYHNLQSAMTLAQSVRPAAGTLVADNFLLSKI